LLRAPRTTPDTTGDIIRRSTKRLDSNPTKSLRCTVITPRKMALPVLLYKKIRIIYRDQGGGSIMSNAVIVSGVRIAVGAFGGSLKDGTVIAMQTFGNLIGHNPCCIF
jgi:hypothetical protein